MQRHLRELDAFLEKVDDALQIDDPSGARSPAREWILDNRHVGVEALLQVRQDLSPGFVRKLPLISSAVGSPEIRTLAVARYLVQSDGAYVDLTRAQEFLRGYQEACPLTMGELWAFPLMLRVALLEELAFLGGQTAAVERLTLLDSFCTPLTGDGDADERASGVIMSLRAVVREDWNGFFEATSIVEAVLRRGDPAGVYALMDFATRDRYRKVIEETALACGRTEYDVARALVEMAAQAAGSQPPEATHLGQFLEGPFRGDLEAALDCRTPWPTRSRRAIRSVSFPLYAAAVVTLAAVALLILLIPVVRSGSTLGVVIGVLLGLVPAITVAVSLVNRVVPTLVSPWVLPKLLLESGIPELWKTAVAVPCLLTRPDEVDGLLEQLEMNFLGNRDPQLTFVLLSDFADASRPNVPGEEALLERAQLGIRELNRRHGADDKGPFLLLHRERRWNAVENRWMGWERKRGKITEFNRLLLGASVETFPDREGDLERLEGTRFVLTLDADTFLPQDAARRLVGTLAHPLNRPRFDDQGRLVAGYTVLQPRVELFPGEGTQTLFSRVFEVDQGLDLYSQAVSDVYQDLIGEGIFTGKGLLDVAAFERSLDGRVPDNTLLSHDLFEGVHGRVGLVSDVVVFEDFPDDFRIYGRRLHRWVRGDWQLLPWLLPTVPAADGSRAKNPIDARGRWKIADNLRRSLLAPLLLALLLAGWFILPGSALWWTLAAAFVLATPAFLGAGLVSRARVGLSSRWAHVRDRTVLRGAGTLRWVLALIFLPHQARIEADAIGRTLYRLFFSRRNLLEWTAAAHSARQARQVKVRYGRWQEMIESPALAVAVVGLHLVTWTLPTWSAPLLVAWFVSPLVAAWTASRREKVEEPLSDEENLIFRSVARRTWAYFEEFVGAEDHWLPPDHFQESPRGVIAHRTSPTNIGLTLTAALAAYDLGYLTLSRLVATLANTLDGMDRLERHRGHLLNWYDTRQLTTLEPHYVSTVDSGNLAACLLVVGMSCGELACRPALRSEEIRGLLDAVRELESVLREIPAQNLSTELGLLDCLRRAKLTLAAGDEDPRARRLIYSVVIDEFIPAIEDALARMVGASDSSLDPDLFARLRGWIIRVQQQAMGIADGAVEVAPWVPLLREAPPSISGATARSDVRNAFEALIELLPPHLPLSRIPAAVETARAEVDRLSRFVGDDASTGWLDAMREALCAGEVATRLLQELSTLERRAMDWVDQMDFAFLYDARRRLFHIGFDAAAGRMDDSYYDLLASEARTASFIAAAKAEVPARHWLQLGRTFGRVDRSVALLSWSGTLFEYLMPALFLQTPTASLLGMASRAAIDHQIAFADKHRVPWGISESSYSHLNSEATYQYRAFGVPALAIRRDVGDRMVVAPYASILALPFRPRAVRENTERLMKLGMFGPHGLYEAIDFGRTVPERSGDSTIVRSYMAHHQGMILAAVANHLTDNLMVQRFHRDPRTAAVSYLLHERTPGDVPIKRRLPNNPERVESAGRPQGLESWTPRLDTDLPTCHFLSNGAFSVRVTARGGGGISWKDYAITRWRSEPSLDTWGSWIYVQDLDRDLLWATTAEPISGQPDEEAVDFEPHRVEFRRRIHGIGCRTTVLVPRDGDVEIRRVVVTNNSGRTRRLRLASFGEVSLANPGEDRRHPAFQKLFVESEYVGQSQALHFRRRRASPAERTLHLVHGLGATTGNVRVVGWETDRNAFLGRTGSVASPAALRGRGPAASASLVRDPAASRGFHSSLDTIFSLIVEVDLPPGGQAQLVFLTATGRSKEDVFATMDKFRSPATVRWARERARVGWEDALHRLELPPQDVRLAVELLTAVIRPFHGLRTVEESGQALRIHRRDALWGLGISGDEPVVLLRITDTDQCERLDELLRLHALWRRMGVAVDVLVLDETTEGYNRPIQDRIHAVLSRLGGDQLFHRAGGVHHVAAARLDPVHRAAVEAVARVRLDASDGGLARQLQAIERQPMRLPPFAPVAGGVGGEPPPTPLERPTDLLFDNTFGGFTPDGREYVIHLEEGEATPAPWINVVATPEMGFVVSERGAGFTWAGNSGEHRITAWANDPVLDRPGEALYIRDEETGDVWSPTPGPAPGPGANQVRHGAGYTSFHHRSHQLDQHTEMFVSRDPGAKVTTVRIHNMVPRPRRLTVTYAVGWTLGGSREREAPHIVTRFEPAGELILARNHFAPAAGPPIAFVASDRPLHGWTADGEEFLGQSGLAKPAGLVRVGLGQTVGGRLDPWGVVQIHMNLEAGEEGVVNFFLGATDDDATALDRVRTLREDGAVKRAREAVDSYWNDLLSQTRVSTPEPALDLLINRWARYQALSCRLWGRSALYQSAGAFGFRDQLQDVLAFQHDAPHITRAHILEAARHQFVEGDVLHWWHPPEARGIRSLCSDDLLWLPFAVASYVRATGDRAVLEEAVPSLVGPALAEGELERYGTYAASAETASLHEHCLRALRRGMTQGENGLPLIGLSDWNDGLDRLGRKGQGESVWLAWFSIATARAYADICRERGEGGAADELEERATHLVTATEAFAWDGDWYLRATHDDGSPIGSAKNPEGRIDSIAQSWSVLSGAGEPARSERAMTSVMDELVDEKHGLVLLLKPPYDRDPRWPGYIRAYPPGIRENGGQYTHAAIWAGWALAALGRGDDAMAVFRSVSPIHHSLTPESAALYRLEPYAVAADIAGSSEHAGRGGWSWFTGSASWTHRLGLEAILGFRPEERGVFVDPCIPPDWPHFDVQLRRGRSLYRFHVENPDSVSRGVRFVEFDGAPFVGQHIPLTDDGREHQVRVVLGHVAAASDAGPPGQRKTWVLP